MIPILYDSNETAFVSNGLGRLRDCISCVVTEERNGIYECDFEYPIDGVNYDRIQCGRIIAVEHDETNDIQPFDIVGYERPINGVVTFHAVHISYRQTAMTVSGTNVNSLADAFTMLGNATPTNPFTYSTDKTSSGFLAAANGVPYSVRSVLGGMEGSILDAYGGEYEWDKWTVKLWANRGELKNFTIRYGLNLTEYNEDVDYTNTYTSVIPYWTGQDSNGNDIVVKGNKVTASYPSFNGVDRCIPLDLTEKFENQPTTSDLETEGLQYINTNQAYLPEQNIEIDFLRITDTPEYAQFATLQKCKLCDSINVIFPKYNMSGQFKIVRTEYDVLQERYQKLELGTLSTSLAEALGIDPEVADRISNYVAPDDYVVELGTVPIQSYGSWIYKKWKSGRYEAWYNSGQTTVTCSQSSGNGWYRNASEYNIPMPTGLGINGVTHAQVTVAVLGYAYVVTSVTAINTSKLGYYVGHLGSLSNTASYITAYVEGSWV